MKKKVTKMLPLFMLGVMSICTFSGCSTGTGTADSGSSESSADEIKTEAETEEVLNGMTEGMTIPYEKITEYNGGQSLVDVLIQLGANDVTGFTCDSTTDDHYTLKFTSKGIDLVAVLHDHPDDSKIDYHVYTINNDNEYINPYYYVNEACFDYEPVLYGTLASFPNEKTIKYYMNYYLECGYTPEELAGDGTESGWLIEDISTAEEYGDDATIDTYYGSTQTFTGVYNGMDYKALKDRDPVTISLALTRGPDDYFISCNFDNNKWRDKLDQLKPGDTITVTGTCENSATWNDCSFVKAE